MLHPILIRIKIIDSKYCSRKNNRLTRKYIIKFTNQYKNDIKNPFLKLKLFGSSLSKIEFYWVFLLIPNSINN